MIYSTWETSIVRKRSTYCIVVLLQFFLFQQLQAQVKIGSPGTPHAGSVLHLDGGGTKGMLLPIVNSKEQLDGISFPTPGLVVYGTHTQGLWYHDGNAWLQLKSSGPGFSLPYNNTFSLPASHILRLVNTGANGTAIVGIANNGKAIAGTSTNGTAIEAISTLGTAFSAESEQGVTAMLMHGSATGNALIVPSGRVALGTNHALAQLHVDGSILFRAPATLPGTPSPTPVTGAGNRMMWYADKAALRAGTVTAAQWDQGNIGVGSVGLGYNASASGLNAISLGRGTIASGDHAVATGFNTQATGSYTTALGFNTTAQSGMETVVGTWNTLYTPNNATGSNPTDRLFVVANGTAANARSNAITVLKNGAVGINTNPVYRLDVAGDINFTSALRINGSAGTAGQVLTSTGTGAEWASSIPNPQVGRSATLNQGNLPVLTAGGEAFLDYGVITGVLGYNDGSIDYLGSTFGTRINEPGMYQIMVDIHFVPHIQAEGEIDFEVQRYNFPTPPPNDVIVALDTKYLVANKNPSIVHMQASKTLKLEPGHTIRVRLKNFSNNNISVLGGAISSISVVKLY